MDALSVVTVLYPLWQTQLSPENSKKPNLNFEGTLDMLRSFQLRDINAMTTPPKCFKQCFNSVFMWCLCCIWFFFFFFLQVKTKRRSGPATMCHKTMTGTHPSRLAGLVVSHFLQSFFVLSKGIVSAVSANRIKSKYTGYRM